MHRFIASEVPPVLSTTLFCNLCTFHGMRCFFCANLSQHLLLHLGTRQIRQREAATVTVLTVTGGDKPRSGMYEIQFVCSAYQYPVCPSGGCFIWCIGGGGAGIVSSSARAVVGQPVQSARFIKLTQLFPPPVSLNPSANHGYSQVKPPGPALSPP